MTPVRSAGTPANGIIKTSPTNDDKPAAPDKRGGRLLSKAHKVLWHHALTDLDRSTERHRKHDPDANEYRTRINDDSGNHPAVGRDRQMADNCLTG